MEREIMELMFNVPTFFIVDNVETLNLTFSRKTKSAQLISNLYCFTIFHVWLSSFAAIIKK